MKHFEVFWNGQWYAWSGENVTISKKGKVVTVVRDDAEHGKITTTFDLTQFPAYTLA